MEQTEVLTSTQLKDIANPNSNSSNSYKGVENALKSVRGVISDFRGLMGDFQSMKNLIQQNSPVDTPKEANIQAKIEKGVEKKSKENPVKVAKIELHTGTAIQDLNKFIDNFIGNEETGKQIKEKLKALPDETIIESVGGFLQKHTDIVYD